MVKLWGNKKKNLKYVLCGTHRFKPRPSSQQLPPKDWPSSEAAAFPWPGVSSPPFFTSLPLLWGAESDQCDLKLSDEAIKAWAGQCEGVQTKCKMVHARPEDQKTTREEHDEGPSWSKHLQTN